MQKECQNKLFSVLYKTKSQMESFVETVFVIVIDNDLF